MKPPRTLRPIVLAILAIAAHGAQAAELVVNGSFETPDAPQFPGYTCFHNTTVVGWTSTSPSSLGSCYIQQNTDVFGAAYDGQQYMYVNDGGTPGVSVQQTLNLVAGTSYQLNFAVSGINTRTNAGTFTVELGPFVSVQAATPRDWTAYSMLVTPTTTGSAVLRFTATNTDPVNVDAVSVQVAPVPEPGTAALMLAGLAVCAAKARRAGHRRDPGLNT